jgi:chaperonin cofactor prefoldin
MEIALIVTGGVVLMTAFATGFDFLTKRRNKIDKETKGKVEQIEARLRDLEQTVAEKDQRIAQLESDFNFLSRLLLQGAF